VALTYQSGEPIEEGDRVRYDGELGHIEEVADPSNQDNWYVQEFGGGCLVAVKPFGRLFLNITHIDERLEFLGRAEVNGSEREPV